MFRQQPLYVLLIVISVFLTSVWAQQPGVTTRYVYDANGRLRAVITPEGTAIYEYDPAGNFTRIRRLNVNDCEALEFSPRQGAYGTLVTIYGVGFGQNPTISFNGKPAEIVSKSQTAVVAKVPDNAESGPLSMTLACGEKTFASPFIVSGIRVTPATIAVSPNRKVQYTAVVAGLIDPGVTWSVNGIEGGNETLGTITESGLYTAPAQAPNATTSFLVRATSVVEPTILGEAQVKITGSGYEFLAQGVSVRYGMPTNLVVTYAATPVAVRYSEPTKKALTFVATPVAVQYGEPSKNALAYFAAPVSVLYPALINKPSSNVVSLVSVQYSPASNMAQAAALSIVSVTKAASITSLSTDSLRRGTTVTLSLQGRNFSPEADITFLRENGEVDTEIRVSELRVSADGTALKTKVLVSEKALIGQRIIRMTFPFGSQSGPSTRTNIIKVIP